MNRKRTVTVLLIAILIVGVISVCIFTKKHFSPSSGMQITRDNSIVGLYCLAESKQEAIEISEAYDIPLKKWQDGVATFSVPEDRDAYEIVEYGRSQGLHELSIDRMNNRAD